MKQMTVYEFFRWLVEMHEAAESEGERDVIAYLAMVWASRNWSSKDAKKTEE